MFHPEFSYRWQMALSQVQPASPPSASQVDRQVTLQSVESAVQRLQRAVTCSVG